jgi:hypothetical protein
MANEKISTYYFIGRLSPPIHCRYFNPGEIHLKNGFVVDVFNELICIWVPGTEESFDKLRSSVLEAFDIIITVFIFITNKKLAFQLAYWVEAKEVISKKNIIGYIVPTGEKLISPSRKGKYAVAWRKAARFYLKIEDSFYHKMAIKDYKNCISSLGDDAFFYAFRIIEDIRRAATRNLPEGLDKKKYWEEMHKILGTSENSILPLTEVSEKVRHGELDSSIVINARKKREEIINTALDVMRKEFRRSFRGLL